MCLCYRKLGLDLIPRIEERIVEPDSIGVYELYNVVSIASPIVLSTNQRSLKSKPRAAGNFGIDLSDLFLFPAVLIYALGWNNRTDRPNMDSMWPAPSGVETPRYDGPFICVCHCPSITIWKIS